LSLWIWYLLHPLTTWGEVSHGRYRGEVVAYTLPPYTQTLELPRPKEGYEYEYCGSRTTAEYGSEIMLRQAKKTETK